MVWNKLSQWSKIIPYFHFWVVVVFFAIGMVLHYPQQILSTNSPSLFSFLGLTRHAVERIFFLLPVGYAGFFLGKRAGLVSLAVASTIMLPRVFLISEYLPDALFETIGVILIGSMINLWIRVVEKLRASEQRYRQLFEGAQDAIWVHDMDGNLTSVNKAAERLSGYGLKELFGMNVRNFLTEESLRLTAQIKQKLLEGEKVEQPYQQCMIRKDGTEGILMLTTNPVEENGKPVGFLCIARDVTREKEMQDQLSTSYRKLVESDQQLKDSQQQLIQAEKLTSLGQLAASIAHEVNNPLSGVLVYTQLLAKKIRNGGIDSETVLSYLSKMEFELNRSTGLIRDLLDFARQSPPRLQKANLNTIINRAFDLVSHYAESQHVQVIKELEPSLPDLVADSHQLEQVFTNLIVNAIQAMPQGGRLTIHSSIHNNQTKIEVQDTGCGISPENMNKLFTPFFTTKPEIKGVGLGLAIAYGIVQRHKGKIEVQSKVGEGTTFTIYIPLNLESDGT